MLPDSIIFDVDGVLIDVRRSYNLAIKNTVTFILNQISPELHYTNLVTDKIIAELRQTGGFNNDVDTCYAILLVVLSSEQGHLIEARKFVSLMTKSLNGLGIKYVEEFLASCVSKHKINKYKRLLNYPSSVGKSLLATVFDEIFYGPELFLKQHKIKPRYYFGDPLIDNDKIIIKKETMSKLSELFDGKISVVSGRSKLAVEYSLETILEYINIDACVFLEDELRKHAKPSPYALHRATKMLSSKNAIYVGDSLEDLLMTKLAEKRYNLKMTFIGTYKYSFDPARTIHLLVNNGARAMIRTVNQLPNMLNKVDTGL
jgi:phosphoglycolate phosphatase-like HAD superfamily hydrolase